MLDTSTVPAEAPTQFFCRSFDLTPRSIPAHVVEVLNAPTLAQIRALAEAISASTELIEFEDLTRHHFADGVYGRELHIPAGAVLVGKMHRHATLNVLAAGEISVSTPEGIQRLRAPAIFTSPAGGMKVGYAHTDCVFLNVHPTDETDLAKIEAEHIVPDPWQALADTKQLEEID